MRDRLIYGYFGIKYEVVCKTFIEEIPILAETVEQMLNRGNLEQGFSRAFHAN